MKLVSWNTQWCCGLDGVVSPGRIVDTARALADFDVLCLQEIAQGFDALPGQPGDQPAQLRALLPGFQVFFGAAVDEFSVDGRRQRFGNLIATRLPVARVEHHFLPWAADSGVRSMPRMCSVLTLLDPALGAVRVMTSHLEYHSAQQRWAQARALREIHMQACELADAPPLADPAGTPFQHKVHTPQALLCGDFNLVSSAPEYALLQQPFMPSSVHPAQAGGTPQTRRLRDAWPLVHGDLPQAPTFHLFDRRYGPVPVACDFVFVSDALAPRVQHMAVDLQTQASDHQPVCITLR